MNRNLIAILTATAAALTLCGCGSGSDTPPEPSPTRFIAAEEPSPRPAESEPAEYVFTKENFPRLDGSTSTAPFAEAVCDYLLGEGEGEARVNFSKTTNAYLNLMSGGADLLIVGEAGDEVMKEKERLDFEWERESFATDAFVFVVNESNPVSSITVEQARDIYSGKITNWAELGGEDREIIPFQRNAEAGSQALMEKLVMQGEKMVEPPKDYVIASMGELMQAVKSFDGSPGAIGYSVYYYAEEMKMAQGLKLLSIDGVEASPETIRSGDYPLLNPKYVVIPADAGEDAPNRALFDWLLSREGQRLAAGQGYVSVTDFEVSNPKIQPEVGGRYYEEYTDELIPGADYGYLIPYAGLRLMDDWPAYTGCLYGLMTLDGRVVVDPVYSGVEYARCGLSAQPLLFLHSGGEDVPNGLYAVAAPDGSWVTDSVYRAAVASQEGYLLHDGSSLTLLDPTGRVLETLSREDMGLTQEQFDTLYGSMVWFEGEGGSWFGDYISVCRADEDSSDILCYKVSDGELVTMPSDEFYSLYSYGFGGDIAPSQDGREPLIDELLGAKGEFLLVENDYDAEARRVFRSDGTPLSELDVNNVKWYNQLRLFGGVAEALDRNSAEYYSIEDMSLIFRTYLDYETD